MSDNQMPVTILAWKPMVRNTLRGFLSIRLGASLKIHDITIHRYDESRCWASFPSKPALTSDGVAKRNDAGKIVYVPVLEWDSKAAGDRFSESVVAALEAKHPDATR